MTAVPTVVGTKMNHIGHIESSDPSVQLTREAWLALIDTTDDLAAVSPKEGINPFTREPTKFYAPDDTVRLIHGGAEIASFSWAPPDYPYVNVSADPAKLDLVIKRANELAHQLGGHFVSSDG